MATPVVRPLLIVEDDRNVAALLAEILDASGIRTITAGSLAEARSRLAENPSISAALLDIGLPDGSGLDLVQTFLEHDPCIPVVVLTGETDDATVARAIQLGVSSYLMKPVRLQEVRVAVDRVLKESAELARVSESMQQSDPRQPYLLIGASPQMLQVRKTVKRVAMRDDPVLIVGEPGTQRQSVARSIHAHSARASEPFAAVDCRTLPPLDLEDQLLGRREGRSAPEPAPPSSRFHLKPKGTLLLNNIEWMPPGTQCRVLDALKHDRAPRPGGHERRDNRARLFAATSTEPRDILSRKMVCEDLLFYFRAFEIHIPPLRERADDISLIVEALLPAISESGRRLSMSPAALDVLKAYDWPGNTTELERIIIQAALVCTGSVIDVEAIPHHVKSAAKSKPGELRTSRGGNFLTLREIQREYARFVLAHCNHIKTRAATTLKISRSTLELLLSSRTRKKARA